MNILFQNLQFFFSSALIIIGAPVFYFLAGLPIALALRKVEWSMLWGVGLIGLTGELACIFGVSARLCTLSVGGASIVTALVIIRAKAFREGRIDFAKEFYSNAESYLISLLAVSVVPFALPGAWGGDWFLALNSGRFLAEAKPFSSELLARPPLFGAASIPLCIFGDPLASFQLFCAIGSACVLQVVRGILSLTANSRIIWLFGGSIFFLQLTANAWPKFLAAAFLIASWICARDKACNRRVVTGCLLGLSIATHQSSILFAPLIFAQMGEVRKSLRSFSASLLVVIMAATIIFVPWELYSVEKYGLSAKIHANPAVSMRLEGMSKWLNGLLVGLSTIVAWGPLAVLKHWSTVDAPFSAARVQRELFWFLTSSLNSLAGCLMGILLPWMTVFTLRDLFVAMKEQYRAISPTSKLAIAISFLGQMVLNPYYSPEGSLQTGWVPVGVGFIVVLSNWVSLRESIDQSRIIRNTLFFGLAPWTLFNLVLTAGLVFGASLKSAFTVSDGDLKLIADAGLNPLGMGAFPWIQMFIIGCIALFFANKNAESTFASSRGSLLARPNNS